MAKYTEYLKIMRFMAGGPEDILIVPTDSVKAKNTKAKYCGLKWTVIFDSPIALKNKLKKKEKKKLTYEFIMGPKTSLQIRPSFFTLIDYRDLQFLMEKNQSYPTGFHDIVCTMCVAYIYLFIYLYLQVKYPGPSIFYLPHFSVSCNCHRPGPSMIREASRYVQ